MIIINKTEYLQLKINQIMKKYLFMLISIAIFMQSCGITQKQKEQATQDSLAIVLNKRHAMIDSIAKIEQNIAIGNIKFGISKKEFNNEIMKFLDKCELPNTEFYMRKTMFSYKLGEYGFRDLNYQFYHDNLYKINFKGGRVESNDYDDVMPVQFDILFKMLKEKYSEPSLYKGLPNWNDLHKNDSELCATWSIGSKQISIFIACKGTEYSLDLCIYKPSVEAVIDKENRDKQNQSIKDAAKIL